MVVRLLMLALLMAVVSAFATPEIPQTRALISSLLAAAALGAAIFISASAMTRLARLLGPLLILSIAAPAACMALQLAPIPVHGLGNPIWETASAALNEPLAERVTVDIWATMQAIVHYNAVVALALVTAVVAVDRQRASQLLDMLVSIAAIVSAYSIWRHMSDYGPARGDNPLSFANDASPAVLGLLLSAGMTVRALEQRRRTRRRVASMLGPTTTLSLGILAMLICLTAILVRRDTSIAIAALLGAGIVLTVFVVRKWFYGFWGTTGALATAAVLFLASFTLVPIRQNADLTIALSEHSQAATERMLQDTGSAGSGAGAYAALLPIHQDIGMTASRERPTAAAAITVEMGRIFLCGLLIIAVLGACTLLRRSLLRGHDYTYAAIGSGAAVSLAVVALMDDSILNFDTSLLTAALFGLAFAQSQSTTASETWPSRSAQAANSVIGREPIAQPARSNSFGNVPVRLAFGLVGVILIAQTVWMLTQRSHLGGSLIALQAVSDTSIQAMSRVPSNSLPRDGDLRGGNLASTARPVAGGTATSTAEGGTPPVALNAFADALHYSPLRGDLWLMLAAISKAYGSARYDPVALLRLSYYTAPNDLALLPLRLTVALGTNSAVNEPELRELIKRDIKIVVANQPALRPAIVAAYQSASADGRSFADGLVSELDPNYLQNMHAGLRAPASRSGTLPPRRAP